MSQYFKKGKGWRYDFTLNGIRYTEAWFKTKQEARRAEMTRKEETERQEQEPGTPTDISFLELVNARLDYVKNHKSERHYREYIYMAKRWVKRWGSLNCSQISSRMVDDFLSERNTLSAHAANKDIRYLKAVFNHAVKMKIAQIENPVKGIESFPENKVLKYIPTKEDIEKVIDAAKDREAKDYLITIKDTMARVGEVNRLKWDDVKLDRRCVILYTRKKKGGGLTPRIVHMTKRLYEVLQSRYVARDESKPWVFWHRYWSTKEERWVEGPYKDRKGLMKSLCEKAQVKYFRYHPLRHYGASVLDHARVPIGSIQKILGHEKRTTTELYIQSINEADIAAMETYEAIG